MKWNRNKVVLAILLVCIAVEAGMHTWLAATHVIGVLSLAAYLPVEARAELVCLGRSDKLGDCDWPRALHSCERSGSFRSLLREYNLHNDLRAPPWLIGKVA